MIVKRLMVGVLMAAAVWQPGVAAASCLDQVEELARATGLAKSLPNIPGIPGSSSSSGSSAPSGSTDSAPSSTSSLLSQFGGGGSSGASATRQVQAANLLQSARSDGAKGDEQGCLAQLAKARQLLGSK